MLSTEEALDRTASAELLLATPSVEIPNQSISKNIAVPQNAHETPLETPAIPLVANAEWPVSQEEGDQEDDSSQQEKKKRGRPKGSKGEASGQGAGTAVPPSTRTTRSAIAAIKDDYAYGAIDRGDISRPEVGYFAEDLEDFEDDDSDGLLIPLENGWVCEKRLLAPTEIGADGDPYSTSFWSPDGERHTSLIDIKAYGIKHRLRLNISIFENAIKSIPPPGECMDSDLSDIGA